VLSCAIHGNETAPVEMLDGLLKQLLNGTLALSWRLLIIIGNPQALGQNKRFLRSDLNRMFGARWQGFPASDETIRAAQLERAVTHFTRKTMKNAGTLTCTRRSVVLSCAFWRTACACRTLG
jgi:succinylglutamate desuccinylase